MNRTTGFFNKQTLERVLSLFLILTLLLTVNPGKSAAQTETAVNAQEDTAEAEESAVTTEDPFMSAEETEEPELPVRQVTLLQQENGEKLQQLLEEADSDLREGSYTYRLLDDGTAALTGYHGTAETVKIPATLGGAEVTIIAENAFSAGIREITIHGDVQYIEDNAIRAGTGIAARQGSYAEAWAQERGYSVRSLTEGILYPGVVDMTDSIDRISILSDTLISIGSVQARRLASGDRFVLNYGNDDEKFFAVTAKRQTGGKTYLTVRKADVSEVFLYRVYAGKRTMTKALRSSVAPEQEGEVFESHQKTSSRTKTYPEISGKTLIKDVDFSVDYTVKTTVTASYRVVVNEGRITSGQMVTEQQDDSSVTVRLTGGDKFDSMGGGVSGLGMTEEDRQQMIETLNAIAGKEKNAELGSFYFFAVPSIGFGMEISMKFGWKVGGSGGLHWTTRTLCTYEYIPSREKWGLREKKKLGAPQPYLTGELYGKIAYTASVKIIMFWAASGLDISFETGIKLTASIPVHPQMCTNVSLSFYMKVSVELGLWLGAAGWTVQLASLGKAEEVLINIKLLDLHYSQEQGCHPAWKCAWDPMDYSIRYQTGTDWRPDSRCYLKEGTYVFSPVEFEVFEYSSESFIGNKTEGPKGEFRNIVFNYAMHTDALDWTMIQPKMNGVRPVNWRMVDPVPAEGEYYWDDGLSVRNNLEAALGKAISNQDDLPKTIILQMDMSDMLHITYDANGGDYPDDAAAESLMVKYYTPGEVVTPPDEQPMKKLAIFTGWTMDPEGTQPWYGGTELTENLYVYAQYENLDPTDHSTVNSRYGADPSLIGDIHAMNAATVNWRLKIGGETPPAAELDKIFENGLDAYEASLEGAAFINSHGQLDYSSPLACCKGRVVKMEGHPIAFVFTDVVNPDATFETFTIPSTLNGLPVTAESGFLRKLKARIVIFGGKADTDLTNTATDSDLFRGNTYVRKVYMDSTALITLGSDAFSGCTSLEGVTLPGTLQVINPRAFEGCTGLTKGILGTQVDTIGEYAFKDCVNLTELTIDTPYITSMQSAFKDTAGTPPHINLKFGSKVQLLPESVFRSCSALKSIAVSDNSHIRSIEKEAFLYCGGLQSAVLEQPGGSGVLESIGSNAFTNTSISEIEIPGSVTSYFYQYLNDGKGYLTNVFYNTDLKKITIGDANGINRISQGMFINIMGDSTVEEIVLRDGVTDIGTKAFYMNYSNLRKVRLPSTLKTIGANAFTACQELRRIGPNPDQEDGLVLPGEISVISSRAFMQTGLRTAQIPGTVTLVDSEAFLNCYALTEVNFGEGVKTIGTNAFANTSIGEISLPASLTQLSFVSNADGKGYLKHPFFGTDLKKITLGGANGITSIPQYMFINEMGDSSLEEVVLRDGLKYIGENGFSGCKKLKKVTLPTTLLTVGNSAFVGCSALKKVGLDPDHQVYGLEIPEGVTTLYNRAFASCGINTARIAGTVTLIDSEAFLYCYGLTEVHIDEGVKTIGMNAFTGTAIREISLPASLTQLSYVNNSDGRGYLKHPFYGTNLKKMTLGGPNGYTVIYQYMFTNQMGDTSLEEIVLREGVQYIGERAFSGCQNLKRLYLPSSLISIASNAFIQCYAACYRVTNLGEQTVMATFRNDYGDGDFTQVTNAFGLLTEPEEPRCEGMTFLGWFSSKTADAWDFATDRVDATDITLTARWQEESLSGLYRIEDDHAVLVSYARGEAESDVVSLPSTWQGYPVTRIENGAFAGQGITRLILPVGVDGLSAETFTGMDELSSVILPKKNDHYRVADGILFTADMKTAVYCPPRRCMTSFTAPEGLISIGPCAFMNVTNLHYVTVWPALQEIGDRAFAGCSGLAWFQMRNTGGPLTIGNDAFADTGFFILFGSEDSGLIQYAKENDLAYNIWNVTYYVDGTSVGTQNAQTDGTVPHIRPEVAEGRVLIDRWYKDAELTEPWDFQTDKMPFGYLKLYAETEEMPETGGEPDPNSLHTLCFEANGGAEIAPMKLAAGTEITLPATVKDGCDGDSWYTADDVCQGCFGDVYTMPDEDVTLHVLWNGTPADYSFSWKQDGDRIVVTGGKNRRSVTIPAMVNGLPVEEIADGAFLNDRSLSVLNLPEGLTTIGGFAFRGSGLAKVVLPGTVEEVGEYAFSDCDKLTEAVWTASAAQVPTGAFSNNVRLMSLSLPEGINAIGKYALDGCAELRKLTLPESVQTIGAFAFRNMIRLQKVHLGRNLANLPGNAFDGCEEMTAIEVADGNTQYESADGVMYYAGRSGIVKYPAGRRNKSYTVDVSALVVEAYAFADATYLRDLVLPEGIAQIGEGAFCRSGITGLDLSESAVTTIPDRAFNGCRLLASVNLPGLLTTIGNEAFRECGNLLSLDIPDSVNKIGRKAFDNGLLLISGEDTETYHYARNQGYQFRLRGAVKIAAESVTAAKDHLTLLKGIGYSLEAEVSPANTTDALLYYSGNEDILLADNAYLRPLKTGETEVILRAGGAEKKITVSIIDCPIAIVPEQGCALPDKPLQLSVQSLVDNYSGEKIFWMCEGASISTGGLLTSGNTGMVTVTAKAPIGSETDRSFLCVGSNGTLQMPAALRQIEAEAFSGTTDVMAVVLPENAVSIDDYAFSDCSGLQYVYLPRSIHEISDSAFSNSPNVTLICHEGSDAAAFAARKEIPTWQIP